MIKKSERNLLGHGKETRKRAIYLLITVGTLLALFLEKEMGKNYSRVIYSLILSIALVALFVGLFAFRVRETEIELIATTSNLSFTVSEQPEDKIAIQKVIEDLSFTDIGFPELGSVEIASSTPIRDPSGSPFPIRLSILETTSEVSLNDFLTALQSIITSETSSGGTLEEKFAIQFQRASKSNLQNHITLEKLWLTTHSQFILSALGDENFEAAILGCNNKVEITSEECNLSLELEVNNVEDIKLSSPFNETTNLEEGSLVAYAPPRRQGTKVLRFTFETLDEEPKLAQQTLISALSFMKIDQSSDTRNTVNETVSGIESGELYLEALNSRKIDLRPGERLRFSEAKGELRFIELTSDAMRFQFRGIVKGMKYGSKDNPRNLMPRVLEWLAARNLFITIFGSLIALSTLILNTVSTVDLMRKK
jgi:hypothetical protein